MKNDEKVKSSATLGFISPTETSIENKLWVGVVSRKQSPNNELAIDFIEPNILDEEIKIQVEDTYVEFEVKFWESSLVIYVLG